jgi:hypothetical protein
MMDNKKSETLSSRVNDIVDPYVSAKNRGIDRFFLSSFIPGSSILYIGSDAEKNINLLNNQGFDAYGIEPSFIEKIRPDDSPVISERIISSTINSENLFFNRSFDAIICSGVMDKIPDKSVFDTAFNLRHNLKQGGRLLLSLANSTRSCDYYYLLFERLGFNRISLYQNSDVSNDVKETFILFHLDAENGTRSLDKIESILNRDKKTATYKLALIRALTDIASTEYNSVTWYNDSTVGIPVRSIAEKWIFYYWPIFESDKFIPQTNKEGVNPNINIAFRKELVEFIKKSKSTGGLSSFYNQYTNLISSDKPSKDIESLLRKIEQTVIKNPVKFSGGDEKIFGYNAKDKTVIVPADIWKEMCLMWHWIGDALILRWGELTSRISKDEIKASEVIDLLIERADPKRDTTVCRDLFAGVKSLECVWTGISIEKKFDIDHVIPYSLWHNNDLWNLLPAHPKVNKDKSDMLPTRALLNKRKDIIKDYWSLIAGDYPARFDYEVSRFTGDSALLNERNNGWHELLFSAVAEAVEITAIQRGCDRWEW